MSTADKPHPKKLSRPHQLKSLTPDQTVAALLRLAMEVSVLRDRLKTQEQLLVEHGIVQSGQIDQYEPDAEDSAARAAQRMQLIEALMKDLSS